MINHSGVLEMQSIWTFLLEYSVVQGVLLALLIAMRNRYFYLSFLLLAVSYLIFHFLYEHFGWHLKNPIILWTNVPFWFTIGPLFYLHGQSLFKNPGKFAWKDLLHFLPALAVFLYFIPFYLGNSGAEKLSEYKAMYGQEYNFDYVQVAYVAQMLVYGYLGVRHSRKQFQVLKLQQSDSDHIHLGLLKNIYWGLIAYAFAAMVVAVLLVIFQDRYQSLLSSYTFVFLALAVIVHVSTYYILVYQKPKEVRKVLREKPNAITNKYASSSLASEELQPLLRKLQGTIIDLQLFKNPNLRISDIAAQLNIPSHHISQCLNQGLGKNFFDFVNEYRVEAVKEAMLNPENQNLTLFAIANDCGFNSHTSFYRIFKKTTGMTPKQYIAKAEPADAAKSSS